MRNLFERIVMVVPFVLGGLGQMPAMGDNLSVPSTGAGLSTGVIDPNFTIVSAPAGAVLNPGGSTDTIAPVTTITPPYVNAPAGTQWIGPNIDNSTPQPTGDYDFRTSFSLAGLDPSTAKIAGVIASDNKITDIELNGLSLGISGSSLSSYLNYTISSGFRSGTNTLDFIVNNAGTGGPTALLVSESGGASVPEPSTLVVFGLAALALFARRAIVSPAVRL